MCVYIIYVCLCIYSICNIHIHIYTYVYTHIYIYIFIFIFMCVRVCVCVCVYIHTYASADHSPSFEGSLNKSQAIAPSIIFYRAGSVCAHGSHKTLNKLSDRSPPDHWAGKVGQRPNGTNPCDKCADPSPENPANYPETSEGADRSEQPAYFGNVAPQQAAFKMHNRYRTCSLMSLGSSSRHFKATAT